MKKLELIILSVLALASASCEKFPSGGVCDSSIQVNVKSRESAMTKSGMDEVSSYRRIDMDGGGVLEEFVSGNSFADEPVTKGGIITTSSHNAINSDGVSFNFEGWLASAINTADQASDEDKANHHFLSAEPTYSGGVWTMPDEFWRRGIDCAFWSYYVPETATATPTFTLPTDNASDAALKTATFSYTLPSPTGTDGDAANLTEFVAGYNWGYSSTWTGGKVNINFHHPLAAVKFTVGDTGISGSATPGANDYVEITKVELLNVKTSANFTATGSGSNGCTITCNSTSGSANYSQAATRAQIKGSGYTSGLFTSATSDYVFFMLPQDLTNVKARITMQKKTRATVFASDGITVDHYEWSTDVTTFTREVTLGGSWASENYYTYKVNALVYFGGETITLPDNPETNLPEEAFDGDGFDVDGSTSLNAWLAPLNSTDIKIIRLDFTHSYTNNSGKGYRSIWLEDKETGRATTDADLVSAARALPNANIYWPSSSNNWPSGYDGCARFNQKGSFTNRTESVYFYIGGEFSKIKVHFDYAGETGHGSTAWHVKFPNFSIVEVM